MISTLAVRAIVINDGKLLCVRLKPYNDVSELMVNSWCIPGGGLDDAEGLVDGIKREMIEETGINPVVGNLLYIQQFATTYNATEHLEFFFHVTNASDYLNVDLSKTTHGAAEIAEIAFVEPSKTQILPEFLTTEDISAKIAANNSPKLFNFQK